MNGLGQKQFFIFPYELDLIYHTM